METHCQNKMLLMNIVSLNSRRFSAANLCLTLCDSTDCSTPGLPVPQYLSGFAQVCVRWIGDAIQPSHPLLPFSPSAFKLSQHQGLLQGVCPSHQVAKVLSFSIILPMSFQGWFPLGLTGLISSASKGRSRVFSSTAAQKHQFFNILPCLSSNSHIGTWLQERSQLWLYGPVWAKWCLCFLIHCLGLS